jgi:hypothetical protein
MGPPFHEFHVNPAVVALLGMKLRRVKRCITAAQHCPCFNFSPTNPNGKMAKFATIKGLNTLVC